MELLIGDIPIMRGSAVTHNIVTHFSTSLPFLKVMNDKKKSVPPENESSVNHPSILGNFVGKF